MPTQKFLQDFSKQIENTLLLEEVDKNYWRENMKNLPESLLRYFSSALAEKDKLVDSYLEKALTINPEAANLLKDKVTKMRKDILSLEENESDNKAQLETMLDEELKKA
ncbi:hypothetical protein IT413_03020 [Candidatus Peregrinibacteria bacterium]|nr:hypothetical protein [Candidatus Peregrinibacteria bacterium]